MIRRVLLPGPVLIGFNTLFTRAWGNPSTPRPYPRVTPTRLGDALLPFACPHCRAVCVGAVSKRRGYFDDARGHSWCPECRGRYYLNRKGVPLKGELPGGAISAPVRVEVGLAVTTIGAVVESGFDLLGVD